MNTPIQKRLTVFHMIGGALVFGYLESEDDNYFRVKQPLNIAIQPAPQGGVSINLLPIGFPMFDDPKTQPALVELNRVGLMYKHELDPLRAEHKDYYKNHAALFSSIIPAPANSGGFKL